MLGHAQRMEDNEKPSSCFEMQVGAMSHGKIESDWIDDFVAGKLLF